MVINIVNNHGEEEVIQGTSHWFTLAWEILFLFVLWWTMLIFPPSTKSKSFANMVELQEDTGVESDRNNKKAFNNGR